MSGNDIALTIAIVGIGLVLANFLEGLWRPAPLGLGAAPVGRYDDAGRRRARGISTESPRRHTMDEIDAHEARKRDRFADLALIAPTPELIREVMRSRPMRPRNGRP